MDGFIFSTLSYTKRWLRHFHCWRHSLLRLNKNIQCYISTGLKIHHQAKGSHFWFAIFILTVSVYGFHLTVQILPCPK